MIVDRSASGPCVLYRKGHLSILKTLIQAGGDVNMVAHHQMSPVHVAAWHGHQELVEELIRAGVCIYI